MGSLATPARHPRRFILLQNHYCSAAAARLLSRPLIAKLLPQGFFFSFSLVFSFLFSKPSTSPSLARTFCFSDHLTFLASSHLASTCRPPLRASSQYFVNNVGGKETFRVTRRMVSFVRHARWRQGPAGGEVVKRRGPRSVLATRVGFCPRQGARRTVQLQPCSGVFSSKICLSKFYYSSITSNLLLHA